MPSADACDAPAPASLKTTNEQEWTFVVPRKSRNGRQRKPRLPDGDGQDPKTQVLRRDQASIQSPGEIAIEYQRARSQYQQDAASEALKGLVRAMKHVHVDHAVCLGIGTFNPPDGGWETKRRTFFQLSAFLDMVDVLEEGKGSGSIPCFFQEPLFTDSDKAFLEALRPKLKVVESPRGFDLVDSRTFLYGVHLYRPIYAQALGTAAPSIFVGTSLDIWDTVSFGEASDFLSLEHVKTIETTYQKRDFPSGDTTSFSSTSIYWSGEKEELHGTPSAESGDVVDLSDKLRAVDIHSAGENTPAA